MDQSSFRIGVGQIRAVRNDVEENLRRIKEMVDRAESEGVQHLVFPELALTGYMVDERFSDASSRLDGAWVEELRRLSKRVGLSIGLIEETRSALFYNSALHLERGKIIHLHRKIYLPTYGVFDERRYFGAGWDVSAYDSDHGRMAMLICGDAWHIPLAYIAAHDGADVLLILAASSRQGLTNTTPCDHAWRWMCSSYALTLSCFVVFANLAGEDGDLDFWGGSFIAGPDGNIVAQCETDGPDLLVADLDYALLREQRIRLPFRRDDSIAHTIHLAQRVMKAKIARDRVFNEKADTLKDEPPAPKPR